MYVIVNCPTPTQKHFRRDCEIKIGSVNLVRDVAMRPTVNMIIVFTLTSVHAKCESPETADVQNYQRGCGLNKQ